MSCTCRGSKVKRLWWLLKQLTRDSGLSRPAAPSPLQDGWAVLAEGQGHIAPSSSHWGSQKQWPRQQPHLTQGGNAAQGPHLCRLSPERGWHGLLLLLSVEQEAHRHCLPPWVSFLVISTSKHQLRTTSCSCKYHCSPPLLFFLSLGTSD